MKLGELLGASVAPTTFLSISSENPPKLQFKHAQISFDPRRKIIGKAAMDSLNINKGYGKVEEHLEDQISHSNPKPSPKLDQSSRLVVIVALSFIFLLTLILCALVAGLINESEFESESSSESIRSICSVTPHPERCFSSISSLNAPASDPELVFLLSLRVAMSELSKLAPLPGKLASKVNDSGSRTALGDCKELLADAVSRLGDSVSAMVAVGPAGEEEELLNERKTGDVRTWITSAITDQDTCLEGLEEMRSAVLDEMKGAVHESGVYMSNSLAILANMKALLHKFNPTLH